MYNNISRIPFYIDICSTVQNQGVNSSNSIKTHNYASVFSNRDK